MGGFNWQSGLALDEDTHKQAIRLFKETKHLLVTNISTIGNGTVSFYVFILFFNFFFKFFLM